MTRNLKVLGLALVALVAMSAMMASAASAASFTVEKSPATITGNQKTTHEFEVTGVKVTCTTVDFEATTSALSVASVKVAALYGGCTAANGVLTATITGFATDHSEIGQKGKCWYRLDAAGSAALECNEADVTIDAEPCTVHIPAQEFASGVTYTNETNDVKVSFNIEKVTANHTDGFLCPFEGSSHQATAKFSGTSTATAETDGGESPLSLTWDK